MTPAILESFTLQCSSHCSAAARRGRLACRSKRLVSSHHNNGVRVSTHRSPSRWYHPVFGLLVCECNEAAGIVSLMCQSALSIDGGLLNRCLRYGYPATLEVLSQTLVQFVETAQLQLGHALLLALSIAASADLIGCGSHHSKQRAAVGSEGLRMRRRVCWAGRAEGGAACDGVACCARERWCDVPALRQRTCQGRERAEGLVKVRSGGS